jgi:hypothetical protein
MQGSATDVAGHWGSASMNFISRPLIMFVVAVLVAVASNVGGAIAASPKEEANRKVVLDFYEKGLKRTPMLRSP